MDIKKTLQELSKSKKDLINYIDSRLRNVDDFEEEPISAFVGDGVSSIIRYGIIGYNSKTQTLKIDNDFDVYSKRLNDLGYYDLLLLACEINSIDM